MTQRTNPYVGLRPYLTNEAPWFFGRDDLTLVLLERLRHARFHPVLGSAGSGKTSLIMAGLLPRLQSGVDAGHGANWATVVFRPGDAPLHHLLRALLQVAGDHQPPSAAALDELVAQARREEAAPILSLMATALNGQRTLLVVADQLEELFAYRQAPGLPQDERDLDSVVEQRRAAERDRRRHDAQATISLLLALATTTEVSAHVMTVMRTESVGVCDDIPGLAERINESALLVPRLTRAQLTEVIEGPARREQVHVSPPLTEALLHAAGDHGDLLPMLQHALHRTWREWADNGRRQGDLDLVHLERIGGFGQAFALEADALVGRYDRDIVSRLFKRLTAVDANRHRIARAARLAELRAAVLPAASATSTGDAPSAAQLRRDAMAVRLDALLDDLTREGTNILRTSPDGDPANPRYELSSDQLIRHWLTLRLWIDEERALAEWFYALAERAARYARGAEAELLPRPAWQLARHRLQGVVTEEWIAGRYDDAEAPLRLIHSFVEVSRGARMRRMFTRAGLAALLIAVVVFVRVQVTQAQDNIKQQQLKTSLYNNLQRFAAVDPTYGAVLAGFVGVELSEDSLREGMHRLQEQPRALMEVPRTTAAAILDSAHVVVALTNGDVAIVTTTVPQQRVGSLPRRSSALPVTWVAVLGNRTIVTADAAGVVESFQLDGGLQATAMGQRDSLGAPVLDLKVAPDSSTLIMRTADGRLRLWRATMTARPVLLSDSLVSTAVAYAAVDADRLVYAATRPGAPSGNGTRLVVVSGLRDSVRSTPVATELPDAVSDVALPADGRVLAVMNTDLIEVRPGGERSTLRNYYPTALAVSPDSTAQVLVGTVEGSVSVFAPGAFRAPTPFTTHTDYARAIYADRGTYVLSASADNTVRWTSRADPTRVFSLAGHRAPVQMARSQSGAGLLMTLDDDGRLRVWRPADWYGRYLLNGQRTTVAPMLVSRFGERMLTTMQTSLMVEDAQGPRVAATLPGATVQLLATSPAGTAAVLGDSSAQRWAWADRPEGAVSALTPLRTGFGAQGMQFSANGAVLFAVHGDSTVSVLNASTMTARAVPAWAAVPVPSAPSLDSAGALVAFADAGGVQVRAVSSAQLVRRFPGTGTAQTVSQQLFPSGKRVLWMNTDGRLQIRDLARAADTVPPRAPFTGAPGTRISTFATRADEYMFAYVTDKGGLYLLEVPPTSLRQVPLTMRLSSNDAVRHVAFDSSGLRLVATTTFGGVYVWELWWDATAGRMSARPLLRREHVPRIRRTAPVQMATTVFSADGKRLHSFVQLPGQPSRRMSWDVDANLVRQQAERWKNICVDFPALFSDASREFTRDANACRFDVAPVGPARPR